MVDDPRGPQAHTVVMVDSAARIYPSFAAFTQAEIARRGLEALAVPVAEVQIATPIVEPPAKRARERAANAGVSPATLRGEGVLEIGRAPGTSALFVRTRAKLHVMHVSWLSERRLDDYAVALAVTWIQDHGLPSYVVARNLGVKHATLSKALRAAGYARTLSITATSPGARRRGRLVRVMRPAATRAAT